MFFKLEKMNDCKVLVIGETHNQEQSIHLMQAVCEYLREKTDEPIACACEVPSSYDKESYIQALKKSAAVQLEGCNESLAKIEEYKSELITVYKELLALENDEARASQLNKLANVLEEAIREREMHAQNSIKTVTHDSLKAKFIEQFDELKMTFKSVDMNDDELGLTELNEEERKNKIASEPSINQRDLYMSSQIVSLVPHNKIVVVHAGNLHVKSITDKLIKMGVKPENISGYMVGDIDLFKNDLELILDYKKQLDEGKLSREEYDRKIYRAVPYLNESTKQTVPIVPVSIATGANSDEYKKIAREWVDNALLSVEPVSKAGL